MRGKTVATRAAFPSALMSSMERMPESSLAATTRRHLPNPRSRCERRSRPDSLTKSIPVTPTSAAPSATNSGISWARTKMASNSPPREAVRARSPDERTSSPASLNSSRVSSLRRPLLGSAIRSKTVWEKRAGLKKQTARPEGTGRGSLGCFGISELCWSPWHTRSAPTRMAVAAMRMVVADALHNERRLAEAQTPVKEEKSEGPWRWTGL